VTNTPADNLFWRWRNVGRPRDRRAYTLIELLLIVTLLGIAGALVIPSMSSSSVLRIQASVRTLVSDITFMQADAMAYQSRRVMVFGQVARWNPVSSVWEIVEGDGYTVYAVPTGVTTLDLNSMWMDDPSDSTRPFSRDFSDSKYGGGSIVNPAFNGDVRLIFDELGGPVAAIDSDDPGMSGTVEIAGEDRRFLVTVEAYTGRVTVTRTE